jgi:hypothetical protein
MIRLGVTVAVLVLALAAAVGVEEQRLKREHARTAAAALTATNLEAERDSTRTVAQTNQRLTRLIGDSMHLVQRKVVQKQLRVDALERLLAADAVSGRYALDVTVDSLRRTLSSDTTVEDRGVRFAHFDLRHPPYTIEAAVTMPPPPDSARLDLGITLAAIHLAARVTCSTPSSEGVRTASIAASSPSWASVRFDRVEQSPELCPAPATARRSGRRIGFAPVVLGVGYVRPLGGPGWWGFFIGSVLTVRVS